MSLLLELAINKPQDYKSDLRTNKESFQDILGRIDCNIVEQDSVIERIVQC